MRKSFLGIRGNFSTLFQIELWERFSFYGMPGYFADLSVQNNEGGLGMNASVALAA